MSRYSPVGTFLLLTFCALLPNCGGGDDDRNTTCKGNYYYYYEEDCDSMCGDGTVNFGEGCDDGNTEDGDGCNSTCSVESTVGVCGDGVVDASEECDDGNTDDDDECSSSCTEEFTDHICGDGTVDDDEECDDGNTTDGDGCGGDCTAESVTQTCGDGIVDVEEECDDGNTDDGDGCSADCTAEPVCGDGTVDEGEECDDGNTDDGDGCSADCTDEDLGMGGASSGGTSSGGASSGGASSGGASSGGTSSGGTGTGGESSGGAGTGGESGVTPEKIIYITSSPMNSQFGGVVGADIACNVTRPGNTGTYKALIVDGASRIACTTANCSGGLEGMDWVLAADTSYGRPDGTLIGTTNSSAIFVFPLDAGMGPNGGFSYWTGLAADWTTSVDTCNGWTSTTTHWATLGLDNETGFSAIQGVDSNCGTPQNFLACVEQ